METVVDKVIVDVHYSFVRNEGFYMSRAKEMSDDPAEEFNLMEFSLKDMRRKLTNLILSGKVDQIDFKLGSLFQNESGTISFRVPTEDDLQHYDELNGLEIKHLVKNRIGQILDFI